MDQRTEGASDSPSELRRGYDRLLAAAREVSALALGRLARLRDFLPGGVVSAPPPEQAATGTERRAGPRWPSRPVPTTAFGVESPLVVEALARDRSESGVGLWSPEPFAVGMVLYLRPADLAEDIPGVLAEVRHCRAEAGGWVLGCRVLHILDVAQLQPGES